VDISCVADAAANCAGAGSLAPGDALSVSIVMARFADASKAALMPWRTVAALLAPARGRPRRIYNHGVPDVDGVPRASNPGPRFAEEAGALMVIFISSVV
jgi:hypothetical protein